MVNPVNTASGGLSGVQSLQKQSGAKAQDEATSAKKAPNSAEAPPKQTEAAPSTQQAEPDTRINSLVTEDLTSETAQQAANDIKDALSASNLSIANRTPAALQSLFAEAS